MNSLHKPPIYMLVVAWVLLAPTLFFVSRGSFSFDHADANNGLDYTTGNLANPNDDSNYYRIQQVVLYGTICVSMVPLLPATLAVVRGRRNRVLFLLPGWAVLSVLWSQDPHKSVVAVISLCLLTLFAVYLTRRFNIDQQIRFFLFIGLITFILSVMLALVYPKAGIAQFDGKGAWQGLFVHKNHCGMVMTYLLIAGLCYDPEGVLVRFARLLYLVGCLGLIAMTQSRTAWLLAGGILCFVATIRGLLKVARRERAVLLVSVIAILAIVMAFAVLNFSQLSLLLGKSANMTGRTDIWKAILPELWKQPLMGYGYRAFWLGMHGESANLVMQTGWIGLGNAENAVLQMWLELGLVGTALMLWVLFKSCKNTIYCLLNGPSNRVIWCSSIVFLSVLALVDGDKVMFPHTIERLLFVIAFVNLTDERARLESDRGNLAIPQMVQNIPNA